MERLAVLQLVVLLLLAAVVPVAADQPQYWYDHDFESDFAVVDCTPFGYPFVVMDHMVGHESEAGYFDHAGNLIRTLYQTQGTDQLYLSTAPGVYLASGPFRYSSHVELLGFDPLLVEARLTGTMWNVRLPGQSATSLRRSGQEVHIIEGEPPGNLIATTKWVGMEAFDEQALCEVLAE